MFVFISGRDRWPRLQEKVDSRWEKKPTLFLFPGVASVGRWMLDAGRATDRLLPSRARLLDHRFGVVKNPADYRDQRTEPAKKERQPGRFEAGRGRAGKGAIRIPERIIVSYKEKE